MDELKSWYVSGLSVRIDALESALSAREDDPSEAAESIRRIAHTLKGSGGTYGFPEISESAHELEIAPEEYLFSKTRSFILVLRSCIKKTVSNPSLIHSILLVDDDDAITEFLHLKLRSANTEIHVAHNARAAKEILATRKVTAMVLDLGLPDMDGRSFLIELKESKKTADIPVFILSAKGAREAKEECFVLGAEGYFEKPFDPDAITAAIKERLAHLHFHRTIKAGEGAQAGRKLLLVDDDMLIVNLVRTRLEKEGFEVIHFSDGLEALKAAGKMNADIVILDIQLPGMDGFELIQNLRRIPSFAEVPIIFLTSLGEEKDVARGFHLGADDYIPKPFSPVELIARIKRFLKKQ